MKVNRNYSENFWINEDIDMTKINDSMELDSGTTIATLKDKKTGVFASLEVRGDVKVFFNPDKQSEPESGDCYRYPSEFPQELKDLISGKETIFRKDGDIKGIEHAYALDDRVYMNMNNWFELFVGKDEKDPNPLCYVVDIEHYTNEELYNLLKENINDYINKELEEERE